MAKKKSNRTRRDQYDDYLLAAQKKTCKDVLVLGFEFPTESRQKQFHYWMMTYALSEYLLYDGNGNRANIITNDKHAPDVRSIALSFDGKECSPKLDEEI